MRVSKGVAAVVVVFFQWAMISAVVAAEEKKTEPKPAAAAGLEEQQKKAFLEQVKSNLAALNLQGVTAQVLGMEYQKELNNLQQMQAVFWDSYKLDVTKVRQGLYRFDEKEGKFVEEKPTRPVQP